METSERVVLGLKAISDLVGPLNKSAIHAIYGPSQVGKTTLMLQVAFEVSDKTGRPALLYDTEGGLDEFLAQWEDVFKKKYPKAKVLLRMKRDFRAILQDHGKTIKVKMSGAERVSQEAKKKTSGKTEIIIVDEQYPSPLSEYVKENKICMVVYDSITLPMKFFGSSQQNFPARNYAQTLWFGEMLNIMDENDCYIFANHHATKNPADPYSQEEMAGGSAVQYISKIILYMKRWKAKGATSYRTIRLARYFSKPPNEYEALIKLTNNGYIDVTKEDMEKDKAEAKK